MQASQKYNRHSVQYHFDHAAVSYDEAAVLQKAVAAHLDERLDLVTLQPKRILDLGAGTGILTEKIVQRYPKSQVLALDLAAGMLKQAKQRLQPQGWQKIGQSLKLTQSYQSFVQADAYQLPLADGSIDLIVSNLMLQWCDDLDAVFHELRRVLRPEGMILFTTFGPDTLKELRQAWLSVDQQPHVNDFIDMHDLGDALIRCGFGQPVMDVETFTLTYDKPIGVLKDLKAIGATNSSLSQRKGLMGKTRFNQMLNAYQAEAKRTRNDHKVAASYEVVHGHAWAAEEKIKGPNRDRSGLVEISLEEFSKQARAKR